MTPEEAIRKIEEYEGKSIWDIWKESNREKKEYGYIVKEDGVYKVIGNRRSVPLSKMRITSFEGAFLFHTHPSYSSACPSAADMKFMLYRIVEDKADGIGIIAKNEVKYYRIQRDIAKKICEEKEKIYWSWLDSYRNGEYAACYSWRAKMAASTRKIRKFIEVVYVRRREDD